MKTFALALQARLVSPLALCLLLGCAGDGDDEERPGPSPTGEGTIPFACGSAADRIDPSAIRSTGEDFAALGRARVGSAPTEQDTEQVRYVSRVDGDDANAGSRAAPWRTLQHAADSVEPGTTVLVDASGPYEGGLEITRGGQERAFVIFRAADPAAPPRIEGDPGSDAVVDIRASYVVFEGFEIANHQRASRDDALGIRVEPDDANLSFIEIRNNRIHDIGPPDLAQDSCAYDGHGVLVQAEGERIDHLWIEGNEISQVYAGSSEVLVINGNVESFCVTRNYVHDVNNIAIDIIGYELNPRETARSGTVADNVVLDASNYWPYCSRGNCAYPAGDESSDGIYVDGGAGLEIAYNVVGRTDHGIELQSENGALIRDVQVHHNVVFDSSYRHLTIGDSDGATESDNVLLGSEGEGPVAAECD